MILINLEPKTRFFEKKNYFCESKITLIMQQDKYQKIIGIFLLFTFLMNFPFVGAVAKTGFVFGIPMLYAYIFGVWLLLIAVLVWTIEKKTK